MKVALVAHERHPISPPFAGGLESFTWHLASGLREQGVPVLVLAGRGSGPWPESIDITVDLPSLTRVSQASPELPGEVERRETLAYIRAVEALAASSEVDLVHNNALHHLPVALSGMLPQPVLTTLHTPPIPWLETVLRLRPECPTAAVSRWVAQAWQPATTARVIPNGVDLRAWHPGPGGDALVWSGRIVPEKAPHVAAEIARAAGLPLRIAGPVHDQAYLEEVLRPRLGDGIELVGHLGPEDLGALLGSSRAALVTPAWDEPYGLVAAEAMACGTPVLALARGGLPEFVHGDGGCVADPSQPVEAIAHQLHVAAALDRRGVRGHAERYCSLDQMVLGYLALYEELLA